MNKISLKYGKGIKSFDIALMVFMLVYVTLMFRFHFLTNEIKASLFTVCGICFLIRFKLGIGNPNKQVRIVMLIEASVVIMAFLINSIVSFSEYSVTNIREVMIVAVILMYLGSLVEYTQRLDEFFVRALPYLNVFWILNGVLVLIQESGSDFMIDTTFYTNLSYDYYSGMFGGNDGTHRITLFASMITLLNMYYNKSIKKSHNSEYKFNTISYLIGMIINIYTSTRNDNIAFFVFLPITIIVFFLMSNQRISELILYAYRPLLVLLIIAGAFAYVIHSGSLGFVRVMNRLNKTLFTYGIRNGFIAGSSDERALLFSIAMKRGGLFGRGFGSIKLLADSSIVTIYGAHFGMASCQSLIYMGGDSTVCFVFGFLILLFCTILYTQVYRKRQTMRLS